MIGRSVFCTFIGRSLRALIGMAALLAALFTAPGLDAQVLYGSIVGTVTDQAGASVPNAKVRITSRGTTQSRETETDAAGTYAFPSLAPDAYEVAVSKPGFQTLTFHGSNVAADNTVRVDAVLRIGAVDTSVDVTAEALSLQTEMAKCGAPSQPLRWRMFRRRLGATTRTC